MDEIRMYKKRGFRYMNFEDDNFTADKERAKEICRRMIREKLLFKETFFFGRTDMAEDEELLTLLQKAHLTRVLIGIESLNQKALNSIHKGQNIENIRRAGAACEKHGIRVIASIVLGLDDDKKKDIRRSVKFAKDIHAYQLQPAIQPKNMSPWDLQEEFYKATLYFYDFKSAKIIKEKFGAEYGRRRVGLAIVSRLGVYLARLMSNVKNTPYYRRRHTKWMYG